MKTAVLATLAAATVTAAVAGAQEGLFKSAVEVVRVDVSVTDRGRPVRGLTAANFLLTDDNVAQRIASVTLERLPLRVVLALDVSGSVEGPALATLLDASRGLVESLRSDDHIAVLTFSDRVTLLGGFDAPRASLFGALDHVKGSGTTTMYDAMQVAFELAHLGGDSDGARPVIVVCTDGFDTGSWLRADDALEAARRAGVVVHTIEPPDSPVYRKARTIDELSTISGGRTWSAKSGRGLKSLFTETLAEMRDRYLLTFSAEPPVRPGWHDLKVTLKNAKGEVLARPGYYVDKKPTP